MDTQLQPQGNQYTPQTLTDKARVCPLHPGKKCLFICTDQTHTDLVFKCEVCVIDQTLSGKNMLLIDQILESNTKTVLRHWPLPEDTELIEKVKELSLRPKPDGKYREDIDKYFKQLRMDVNAQIDAVQAKMKQKADKLWDYDECILRQYSDLSATEELKRTLMRESAGLEEISVQVKEIVEKVLKNQNEAKEKLESCFAQLALQENAIDFEAPRRIQAEVLERLAKIDMFLLEDIQDLKEQQKDPAEENNREREGNLGCILQLMSSRLNNTSQAFQEKMKTQMQRLNKIIEKFDLGDIAEERKWVIDLELLDEQDIQQTKSFLSALIQSKKRNDKADNRNAMKVNNILSLIDNKCNFITDEFLSQTKKMFDAISQYVETFQVANVHSDGQSQEQFEDFTNEQLSRGINTLKEIKDLLGQDELSYLSLREVINVGQQLIRAKNLIKQPEQIPAQKSTLLTSERVLQLVSNSSNFCSQEMLNQLNTAFKAIPLYLSTFKVSEAQPDPVTWQGLDPHQIAALGKLGNKIGELNEQSKGSFQAASTIEQNRLPKSWSITQLARQSQLLIANDMKELEEVLLKYPILELANTDFKLSKILQWSFTKSNYSSGSQLEVMNTNEGVKINTNSNTGLCQAVFSDQPLDMDIVYTFTCTFSRPLNGSQYFYIGLIQESQIQSTYVPQNNSFSSYSGHTYKLVIKGQLVNTSPISGTMTQMQFRFCIGQQAFFYADSTLSNINQVDPKNFDKNEKYRVGIFIYNQPNLSVKLSNLTAILDQKQVDKF